MSEIQEAAEPPVVDEPRGGQVRHLITRTITETFEYDPKIVLSDDDIVGQVLGLFEKHTGSEFGSELFGDTGRFDVGYELSLEDDYGTIATTEGAVSDALFAHDRKRFFDTEALPSV